MRILGIDPGENVGLSFLDTQTNHDMSWQYKIDLDNDAHLIFWALLQGKRADVIICEDFYHVPRYMKLSMITSELIGIVKLYAQQRESVELIMQNRGMKQGWPDVKIKALGLWQPGEGHAMDALRHRLVYQEKHGMIDWSKLKQ